MSLAIGILGADIGALTLALCCHQAGLVNITLYDSGASRPPRGLVLSPNATRVFKALGCLDAISEVTSMARAEQQRSWRSGLLIANLPLGRFAQQRYGAPFMQLLESDLLEVLRQTVANRGLLIKPDTEDRTANIDPLSQHHDLLIRTVDESLIRSTPPPADDTVLVWHGLTPTQALTEQLRDAVMTRWLGPGISLSCYYVAADRSLYSQLTVTDAALRSRLLAANGDFLACLMQATEAWHPVIRTILAGAEQGWLERSSATAQTQYKHSADPVLLGEAICHYPDFLHQAAALAVEDAWVLARMLDNYEENPEEAIQQYARYRQPRRNRVQQAATTALADATRGETLSVLTRNLRLGFTSRYLPEVALQHLDQLFEYDCIKGFH